MHLSEEYMLNQPEPYRSILLHLQVVIEHAVPNVELKFKWRIPFYYYKGKPFCYLNASHKKQFVDVGLVKGTKIKVHQEHQITEKLKLMMSLRYKSVQSIDDSVLIDILNEALLLY